MRTGWATREQKDSQRVLLPAGLGLPSARGGLNGGKLCGYLAKCQMAQQTTSRPYDFWEIHMLLKDVRLHP